MSATISLFPKNTSWKYAGTIEKLPEAIASGSVSHCCSCTRLVIRPWVTQVYDEKGGESLHLFCPYHRETRHCAHVGKCQDSIKLFAPRKCKTCNEVIPTLSGYVKSTHFHLALSGDMPWRDVSELCKSCGNKHIAEAAALDWRPGDKKQPQSVAA